MGKAGLRSIVGGVLMLVGTVLLLVSITLSWYTLSIDMKPNRFSTGTSGAFSFSPDGQVTLSYSGLSAQSSYSTARLNQTGNLYALVEGVLVLGAVCAGIGGSLAIANLWRPKVRRAAGLLGILGLAFALIGPVFVAYQEQTALGADFKQGYGSSAFVSGPGSGVKNPTNSFSGTATANNVTLTWGPVIGWYLGIAAGAICLAGALVTLIARRGPEEEFANPPAESPGEGAPDPSGSYAASPPRGPASNVGSAGYLCSSCQIRLASVAEFQAHIREVHSMGSSTP